MRSVWNWLGAVAVFMGLVGLAPAQTGQEPDDAAAENDQTETPQTDVPTDGDPVILSTGNLSIEETDLELPGRGGLGIAIRRYYRNGTSIDSALGPKWDLNWFKRIVVHYGNCSTNALAGLYYYDGETRIGSITQNPAGEWEMPHGYFAKIRFTDPLNNGFDPPSFEVRFSDGTVYTFADASKSLWISGCTASYWLTRVQDRLGNTIELDYQTVGTSPNLYKRLSSITDTWGRSISFTYASSSTNARLTSITDYTGRSVSYGHDGSSRLTSVTTPVVADALSVSLGNAFPTGKVTQYEYLTDDPVSPQRFNIRRTIDPRGYAYMENVYSTPTDALDEGRVVSQLFGGTNDTGVAAGGKYCFLYDFPATPLDHSPLTDDWSSDEAWLQRGRTLVVSPNGNVTLTVFDRNYGDILTYRFTGRLDPNAIDVSGVVSIDDLVTVDLSGHEAAVDPDLNWLNPWVSYTAPLHGGADPLSFITYQRRDYHGLVLRSDAPGASYRYTYNNDYNPYFNAITHEPLSQTPDRLQHANLLKLEQLSTDPDNPNDSLVTLYVYEPIFNQLRATVDPRGTHPLYVPQNGGVASPARYLTKFLFDYQELDWSASAIQAGLLGNWGIDTDQFYQSAITGSLLPSMADEDSQPDLNGDGLTVTPRGLVLQHVAPTANVPSDLAAASLTFIPQQSVSKYVYNSFGLLKSTIDPEGAATDQLYYSDATPNSGPLSGDAGGFLAEISHPLGVHETFQYDLLGRETSTVDGRGFATQVFYNALNQVVRETDAAGNSLTLIYDANDNIVESRKSNRRPELSPTTGLPTGATVDLGEIRDFYKFDLLDQMIEMDRQAGVSSRLVTRYRYDRESNRVLTLLPEWVAGNDAANVQSSVFDERNLIVASAEGGLGDSFRETNLVNQAHAEILAELGATVVDLPQSELSLQYNDYTLKGDLAEHHDGESKTWRIEYDRFGRATRRYTPGPALSSGALVETDTLDPLGQVLSTESRQGDGVLLRRAHRKLDEAGRTYQQDDEFFSTGSGVTVLDGPLTPGDGRATRRTLFDRKGRSVQTIDDNRSRRYMFYDALDRLIAAGDDPNLGVMRIGSRHTYDKAGNLILTELYERKASNGLLQYFREWSFFDQLGRAVARVNNLGHTERTLYDSRSNAVFHSDAQSNDLSLLLTSLDTFAEHASLPNLSINAHGNVTVFEFDDAGRSLATRRYGAFAGGEITTSVTYDRNGRVKTEVDDKGNTTTHTYDSMNRVARTTFGDLTLSEVLDYDRNHRVKSTRDANGTQVLFNYDDAGRMIQRTIFPGAGVSGAQGEIETFGYDGLGRVVSASDADSVVARFYDSLSQVVREDSTHNGLTRSVITRHNGLGLLTDLTYPGGRVLERLYDDLNRLTTVRGDGVDFAKFSYIGATRVEKVELHSPAGAGTPSSSETRGYDGARRISSVHHVRALDQSTIDRHTFTYDRVNNKLSRRDESTLLLHEYGYDAADRMRTSQRSVVGQPGHAWERSITYTLDDAGNRQSVLIGVLTQNYTMNAADSPVNQYTNTPVGRWFHDDNGNMTAVKPPGPVIGQPGGGTNVRTLKYDYKNRLVEVWNPDTGTTTLYAYDAFDRRIRRTVGSVVTRFFYAGWREIEEQDSGGSTLATYVYGREIDEVRSMRRFSGGSSVDYAYHADDQGNVMKLTNAASGAVVESYDYDDYGKLLNGSTLAAMPQGSVVGNPFFFTGRRLDTESGLYFYRHRYLDPVSGRFVARDPIGIWGDAGNIGNGYTYCGNNPWSYSDPLGLKKCTRWEMYKAARRAVRNAAREVGLLGNTGHHGSASGNAPTAETQGNTAHHGSVSGNMPSSATQGNTAHHGSVSGAGPTAATQGNTEHHGSVSGNEPTAATQGNTGHYGSRTHRYYQQLQAGKTPTYRHGGDTIPVDLSLIGLDLSKFDKRPKLPTTGSDGWYLGDGQKPQTSAPATPSAPSSTENSIGAAGVIGRGAAEGLGKGVLIVVGYPSAFAADAVLTVTIGWSDKYSCGDMKDAVDEAYDRLDELTSWMEFMDIF